MKVSLGNTTSIIKEWLFDLRRMCHADGLDPGCLAFLSLCTFIELGLDGFNSSHYPLLLSISPPLAGMGRHAGGEREK